MCAKNKRLQRSLFDEPSEEEKLEALNQIQKEKETKILGGFFDHTCMICPHNTNCPKPKYYFRSYTEFSDCDDCKE